MLSFRTCDCTQNAYDVCGVVAQYVGGEGAVTAFRRIAFVRDLSTVIELEGDHLPEPERNDVPLAW